ncbi:MAG: HAD family hydrolase [Chloroflexota bacterium]|nr:HAD family hydrolase [Chloroflexota bacterium]
MIHGVIFDLGSTLMYFDGKWEDVDKQSTASLVAFLKTNGVPVDETFPALFLEHRKRGWKLAEETGIEHTVAGALRDTLTQMGHFSLDGLLPRALETFFALSETRWHPYADALETLQALKARGLRVGLISNADDDGVVQRMVVRHRLAPDLSPILSSAAEPRWRKPDPRIFHLVSAAWHLTPAEIAMVGDAARYDVLGAHRAGMRGILIDRGDNAPWQKIPDELASDPAVKPDATVSALAEILDVLDGWYRC